VGSGTLTFTMPAAGGTCTITGSATMTGSDTVIVLRNGSKVSTNLESSTNTDFGPFTIDDVSNGSYNYSGWYCYKTGPYAGSAGCDNLAVKFTTLPSAAEPVKITFAIANFTSTGTCPNDGATASVHTAQSQLDAEAYAKNGTYPPAYYSTYQAALYSDGYESAYEGEDSTAKEWLVSIIPETNLATPCTMTESFNYTITVTQGTGIAGGVKTTQPADFSIYDNF
jgi:hypothetical protein